MNWGHLTRRDFVRTSAGLAAASIVPSALGQEDQSQGRTALRVGLIGCGGRGAGAAVQALCADRGAVLYAAADVFSDRLEQGLIGINAELARKVKEEEFDARLIDQVRVESERRFVGFDAYQKVIDCCDVVVLCEPPHFRPRHLRAAVEAGRHVFCEKPVAVDAPGARSVLQSAALAKHKNLSLVSGYCWRYSARERDTFAQLHEGAIGDIHTVSTTYNCGGWVGAKPRQPQWSDMEYHLRNWHYFTWLSGDHIVEQACHAIDWTAWAMGGRLPVRCTAVGGRQARDSIGEPGNVYDHFSATFDYEGGAQAFHMCRHFPNTPFDNSMIVLGSKGRCMMNSWADHHEIDAGGDVWKSQVKKNDMYQQEHDELFASIRTGKPINDGVWMAHSTMMALMARMAAYTGQVITWEQALNSTEELKPAAYEWGEAPSATVAIPGLTRFS